MRIILMLSMTAVLVACGGSGSSVGSNADLIGTWQSNCYAESSYYLQDIYTFRNGDYLLDNIQYEDSDCNHPTGNVDAYTGTYQPGLNVTAGDGAAVTRISMEQINSLEPSETPYKIKAVFRITGDTLSIGPYIEGRTPELLPNIVYTRQADRSERTCSQQIASGIEVSVFEHGTQHSIACGVTVIIKADDYYLKLEQLDDETCNDSLVFLGADERTGRYDIIVQKEGFQDWYQDDVVVTANVCHVNTISINAYLRRNAI